MNSITSFLARTTPACEPANLYQAAAANDINKVRYFVQNGSDPFLQDPKTGNTAFHIAATLGTAEFLTELSRGGIAVGGLDIRNKRNKTPLYIAAVAGNAEGCKFFIDHGAYSNTLCTDTGLRPIHVAALLNNASIIELFSNSPIDAQTTRGCTAFTLACTQGNAAAARTLLALGANPWVFTGNSKWTPLHIAALQGHVSIIRLFEGWPEKIDDRTSDGATPFFLACQSGHLAAACELLVQGADPLVACGDEKETALHTATQEDKREIIDLLRHNQELLEARNKEKGTPLCLAALKGHDVAACLLLEAGANPNVKFGTYDETPLHIAADLGHANIIRCFKTSAVVVDATDIEGCTPFFLACKAGNFEEAQELVFLGAKIDRLDQTSGESSLHTAAYGGHASIIDLFSNRPDILDARNLKGNCALHIAGGNGHIEFVRSLLAHGASIRVLPKYVLSYPRDIIDVFLENQKQKLEAFWEKSVHAICIEDALDILIDQEFLIGYFLRTLKIDAILLSTLMNKSPYMDTQVYERAYQSLPVQSRRDGSRLYNHTECRKLLEYLVAHLAHVPPLNGPVLPRKRHIIIESVLRLFSTLQQNKPDDKPVEELFRLYSFFYQKHKKALKMQTFEEEEDSKANKKILSYPLTDAEFYEANIYDLLIKRYGLKREEICCRKFVNTGLLKGCDLCLIGVDNGFYHADTKSIQKSLDARINALVLWRNKHPEHHEQIEHEINSLYSMTMKIKISSEEPIDEIEKSLACLSLTTSTSKHEQLYTLDRDSAIILINMFINKKEERMAKRLIRADTMSLSEYVAKKPDEPFFPQYV